ncbi:hypothetical protein NAPIS_ORF01823 [Vairimorpha apis BRL 01]|uniref:Uncharacterized protein n=1 Tax=Vairimorpha apis BRL 01 TaxID=1037528 RepID=T0KZ93_9MICR|nr:hypothetical protein NAPIS_ORF01823 [Vairimorpha apis BRL 01]
MNKSDENIEEILNKYQVKDKFLNNFESYIDESGLKTKLNNHLKIVLKRKKVEDIEETEIYNIIMDYMTLNLPEEVQEKLYNDIRKFVDENINFD